MSAVNFAKNLFLTRFSRPAADRTIYRAVLQNPPRAIVEIGVAQGLRTQRLLELLLQSTPAASLRYTGIDLFEARPATTPGMSLKQAHALLKPLGMRVQLVPGDPYTALARVANGLRDTDLLLIGADQDPAALARAWVYVPRMLHAGSHVYVESARAGGETEFQRLSAVDVERLAESHARALRRAA